MFYFLKKNWKISLLVCIIQISLWGMQAGIQLLLMETFDSAMALDFNTFMYWMIISLLCWAGYFLLGIAEGYFQSKAVKDLNNQVRHSLYLSIMNKEYNEYYSLDSGSYISWLTNNVKQIENLAWNPFFNGVGRISQIIWSMIALAYIDWILLIASLIIAIIMWFIPKLFEKKMEDLGRENSKNEAIAVGKLKDLLSGLYVLKLFGKESIFLEKGNQASDEIESSNFNLKYNQKKVSSIVAFISVFLQLFSTVLVVVLAFNGRIKLAVMAGGSNLISGVSNGFSNIADIRLSISASKPYFDKIDMDIKEETIDIENKDDYKLVEESIVLNNINFSYGEKTILEDFNIKFKKGKKYAIIGPSGSGKTTLLKLILGWITDYSGSIKFDDIDARKYSIEEIQREISYIEQDVFLFNDTLLENITLGEKFTKSDIERAIKDSSLDKDILNMPDGLNTIVGERGNNISGGQRQRLAIARALIHKHSILLVDEGTSALDKENASIVEESLLNNPDLTLILISHHLSLDSIDKFDHIYKLDSEKNMK